MGNGVILSGSRSSRNPRQNPQIPNGFRTKSHELSHLTNLHPLDRRRHIRHSEPDGFAHFEVRDHAGHAPVAELAAADFQMTGEVLFGE